jgi:Tol biopolymer transport system component
MPSQRKLRSILAGLVAIAALAFAAPAALAADAHYEGISEDGGTAVFSTTDKLVAGDTDTQRDVYVRDFEEGFGYVTREASLGPTGGNDAFAAQFLAIDAAGEKVFFSTRERLVASDTDTAEDVYARDLLQNETTLVSAGDSSCSGSGCGNADLNASPAPGGMVDGGKKVFFISTERLSSEDTDSSADIYMRDLEVEPARTELVSAAAPSCAGVCGSGTKPVTFQGASSDGSKAIFTTAESLAGADEDEDADLYERDLPGAGGETKLVSTPGAGVEPCPAVRCEPSTSGISSDGSHVFFETSERISAGDEDDFQDVYAWTGGTPVRISVGTGGNGEFNAIYAGSSDDGSRVLFETEEKLAAADLDLGLDVYVRTGGANTDLVSGRDASCVPPSGPPICGTGSKPAKLAWVSPSGATAVFNSDESLTAADEDNAVDLYSRDLAGGSTTLVSRPGPSCSDPECGNREIDASFAGASEGGAHLFFVTAEALAPPATGDSAGPGDRDEKTDVYDRSGGATTLVSAGQVTGSGAYSGNGPVNAFFQGVSADGSRTFLVTKEQLTAEDSDTGEDVYMRSGGGTLLVSRSNDAQLEAELAPPGPLLVGTHPGSPDAATSIRVYGSESVEDATIKLYSSSNCTGEPVATGTAAQLKSPGIQVTVALGSATTFRAIAEAEGFVSPCSGEVFYRQQSKEFEEEFEEDEEGGGVVGLKPAVKAAPQRGPLIPIPHEVPQTRITFGPAFKTRIHRPVFRFTDATGQQDTTFVCKLDRAAWKPCGSPLKLPKVALGKHLLRVKGVNAVGVWEAKPTRREFKVVAS